MNYAVVSWMLLSALISTKTVAASTSIDSVEQKTKAISMKVTSRFHSAGFFYFGGKVAEYHPAFDLHFNVETKFLGYTFFKAFDLQDIHSSFNFALAGVYKNIPVGKKLKFTPQVIILIEQPHKVVDEGSDLGGTLTTALKLTDRITFEETFILFNVLFETKHMDIINRFRLLYSEKHLDVIFTGWHNHSFLDEDEHSTGALSLGYNRIKVRDQFLLGLSIMGSTTIKSSNREEVPERKGIVCSVTATLW
jgi:hypothetical protein